MRFDLNRSMENEKTSKFTMIIIGTFILLIGITLSIMALTGGHIRTPLLEIERSQSHKDTVVIFKKDSVVEK